MPVTKCSQKNMYDFMRTSNLAQSAGCIFNIRYMLQILSNYMIRKPKATHQTYHIQAAPVKTAYDL